MDRRSFFLSSWTIRVVLILVALNTMERHVATQSAGPYTAVDLGTLGGSSSVARGVADLASAVTGSSTTAAGATHAFRRRLYDGFLDLGTLGGTSSEGWSMSLGGSYIVGRAQLSTGKYHAFLWEEGYPTSGPIHDLGTLGGSESIAYGVNDSGTAVGSSLITSDTATRAFVYRSGAMSGLPVSLGGGDSVAFAINNYDHVVGRATLAGTTVSHAYFYDGGVVTDLGSPGGASVAVAINDADQVAGYWYSTNNTSTRAFVYVNGTMQTLPGLGGSFAYARAISEKGVVAGDAQTSGGVAHAVMWRDGLITDLNTLLAANSGWVLQSATDLDGWGNIIGYGTHNGQTRAFLLSPPIDVRMSISNHLNQLDTNIPKPQEAGRSLDLGATVSNDTPSWATGLVITDTLTGPVEYTWWDSSVADCTQSGQTLTCRLKAPLSPGGSERDLMFRARTTAAGSFSHSATVRADQFDPDTVNNSQSETNTAVSLSAFTLNSPVVGGGSALGRTTLTSPAPGGGATIKLASSNPTVAAVPAQFDVLPWSNDGLWREFYVTTQPVTQDTTVQISATYGLVTIARTLTILASTPSSPYGGTARAVPGTIQAEDFDNGGEGVAYHDANTANNGGAYRSTSVDIEATSDIGGGYNVGWIAAGEWLKFTVKVATAGNYTLEVRVASRGAGGSLRVEANGTDKTGPIAVPDTGGWQSWRTVSKPVTLGVGTQVLRVVFAANASGTVGNFNYLRLTGASTGATPYGGTPWPIPGKVQAENFDVGGEGVAYHDTTSGNTGGAYRTTNVDLESTVDTLGGYNIGWMAAGEWLQYTVNVASAGTYTLGARVAINGSGGTFHVEIGGTNVTGPMTIPNTGGWQKWVTITRPVTLPAGTRVMRVVLDANGSTGVFGNLNYVSLTSGP